MLRGLVGFVVGGDEWSPDRPGRYTIDANLTRNKILRQRFRKRVDCAFGRRIVEQLFVTIESGIDPVLTIALPGFKCGMAAFAMWK